MEPLAGELTCRVHLAATVQNLMVDGGAVLLVREVPYNNKHFCTCRLAAEFLVANVGQDEDTPFPLFQAIT